MFKPVLTIYKILLLLKTLFWAVWKDHLLPSDAYRTDGTGQFCPPPPALLDLGVEPGFQYPLFLVSNGMTFEDQMRKLSDTFHIKLIVAGGGGGKIISGGC